MGKLLNEYSGKNVEMRIWGVGRMTYTGAHNLKGKIVEMDDQFVRISIGNKVLTVNQRYIIYIKEN